MKIIMSFVVLIAITLITGCSGFKIKKEAFAKPQTLAVVTLAGAVRGMYTNETEDIKILNETSSVCHAELAKSKNVRIVSSKNVLNSKSYAAIKDDGAPFSTSLVPGYKGIATETETKNLKALAKELRVDGFITTTLVFAASQGGGVSLMGISVGAKKPEYTIAIKAYTPEGESIWEDYVHGIGEDGITTVMGIGSYSSLIPKLNGVTKLGCQQLMVNLNEQLAIK